MKALLFRPGTEGVRLEDVELDEPRGREVVVRVVASGLCASDLHFMHSRNHPVSHGIYGLALNHRMQPGISRRRQEEADADLLVMGHEPAGVVEAVGSEVTSLTLGDRVIGCGTAFCGACRQCLLGRPHLCLQLPRRAPGDAPRVHLGETPVVQFGNLGAFAERMLVHETSLVKLDDDIPFTSAAIVGCSVATGVGAALNTARVKPGSSVAVFGAGGIGMSIVQGARIAGARQIIAVDIVASKLAMALELGATNAVNSIDGDPVEQIFDLTDGQGVDYSFYATPVPVVAQQSLDCLGVRGTLTCLAGTPTEIRGIVGTERRIQGCHLGSTRLPVDIPRYLELYRQGRLKLDEMVSVQLPPDEFDRGVEVLNAGGAARVVFNF